MAVIPSSIPGLFIIKWPLFEDERGFFKQSYQVGELRKALGRDLILKQGNHSRSAAGVVRGFHTEPWDKLVYVVRGTALCVVADPRPNEATFGRFETYLMGDAPGEPVRLLISKGLSNAFYCFSETDYLNDVSEEFNPASRSGIRWNDPDLGVEWPTRDPILSDADRKQPFLRELFPNHAKWLRAGN